MQLLSSSALILDSIYSLMQNSLRFHFPQHSLRFNVFCRKRSFSICKPPNEKSNKGLQNCGWRDVIGWMSLHLFLQWIRLAMNPTINKIFTKTMSSLTLIKMYSLHLVFFVMAWQKVVLRVFHPPTDKKLQKQDDERTKNGWRWERYAQLLALWIVNVYLSGVRGDASSTVEQYASSGCV